MLGAYTDGMGADMLTRIIGTALRISWSTINDLHGLHSLHGVTYGGVRLVRVDMCE